MVRKGRPGLPGLLEPDLRTVSAAGDLPVPLLFYWRAEKAQSEMGARDNNSVNNRF